MDGIKDVIELDVIKLLEYLNEIIQTSSPIPFTGKVMVNKEEVSKVINDMIINLPDTIKKAEWILQQKDRILKEAIDEAKQIKIEKLNSLEKKIDNIDITREARNRADQIIALAQRDAKAIRLGARDYADQLLSNIDKEIFNHGQKMVNIIAKDVEKFIENFNEEVNSTSKSINTNLEQLRNMK